MRQSGNLAHQGESASPDSVIGYFYHPGKEITAGANTRLQLPDAKAKAQPRPVTRLVSLKKPFTFRIRTFDDKAGDEKIARYMNAHVPAMSDRVREVFGAMRRQLQPQQGQERTTALHVMLIGDIAIAGVPAEYFTGPGVDIKRRSPLKDTFIAELANDRIGYPLTAKPTSSAATKPGPASTAAPNPALANAWPTKSWRC